MIDERKCAVVGVGNVGATIAYTYTMSGLFSEMVLIDKDKDRARGEAMDLSHGLPFLSPMNVYAGSYADVSDAALIVIAAGAAQKPGETRLQLLQKNMQIFEDIVGQIVRYNRDAILLVVTNPVDILTYYTLKISGYPPNRVIGSGTVLDTARLKQLLGALLAVDSRNVHTFIIGEHGDSELPVWSSANISGVDLADFCRISGNTHGMETIQRIFLDVRDSAYHIIECKGATYYAIGQAVLRITSSIMRDENSVLPVSTLVSGHYGLSDVCLGVPSVLGVGGVKKILDIPLNDSEKAQLKASADVIQEQLASLETLTV